MNTTERRVRNFHAKVDASAGPGGCWYWLGYVRKDGYGLAHDESGRTVIAHRMAYRLAHGDAPVGLDIDHACHNASGCPGGFACPHRRCCNPVHLRAVTRQVNQQSSPNVWKHGKRARMDYTPGDRRTVAHSGLTAGQRSQRARVAALSRWSVADPVSGTAKARAVFLARFERQVDPGGRLDPVERARRAEAAKRAYFQRMAFNRGRRAS